MTERFVMRDSNFLKENNARHTWHPMAHPAEMQNNPPKVIVGATIVSLGTTSPECAVSVMAAWSGEAGAAS